MKVLVIGTDPCEIGGIASFERTLINIFSDVDFLHIGVIQGKKAIEIDKNCNVVYKSQLQYTGPFKRIKWYMRYFTYLFSNCTKQAGDLNSYDAIILNIPLFIKDLKNYEGKIIIPQHSDVKIWKDKKAYFGLPFQQKKVKKLIKEKDVTFLVSSKLYMKEINKYFPKCKVEAIYYTTEKKKLFKEKKDKTVCFISRLSNLKRVDIAMDVMKYLPDFSLTIVGSGENEEYVLNRCKKEKNIKFVGFSNETEVEFSKCSFYLNTSDYEGFPIAAVEALQCGLIPIIRKSFPAAPELTHENLLTTDNPKQIAEKIKNAYVNYDIYYDYILELRERHQFETTKDSWFKLIKKVNKGVI